jgi:hypothetical protein
VLSIVAGIDNERAGPPPPPLPLPPLPIIKPLLIIVKVSLPDTPPVNVNPALLVLFALT